MINQTTASQRPPMALLAVLNAILLSASVFLGPIASMAAIGGIAVLLATILSEFGFVFITTLISHINDGPDAQFEIIRLSKWIIIAIALVVTLWQFLLREDWQLPKIGFIEKYFAVFIVWGMACLFFSDSPRASITEFVRSIALYILYFITKETVRDKRRVIAILALFTLVAFSSSVYSIGELLQGSYFRVRGFMDNANGYGQFLSFVLPFVVASAVLARNKLLRYFLVFASTVGVLALMLSWSRAAIGGIIVQLIVFLVAEKKYRALVYTGAATAALMIGLLAIPSVYDIFYKVARLQAGTTHRTALWEAGIHSVADSPVFGQGFEVKVSDVIDRVYWNDLSEALVFKNQSGRYYAHNHFIQAAVATGIPGLLIFLAFMYYLIKNGLREYHEAAGTRARVLYSAMLSVHFSMIFVCFFSGAPLFGSGTYANYFWIALGMVHSIRVNKIAV